MSDSNFVHLHVHTEYSMLDGAARLKPLFEEVKRQNMPAIAMSDHGNLHGAYAFWKESQNHDVKGIIGVESYVAPRIPRTEKKAVRWADGQGDDVSGKGAYTHMTMWAENNDGLHNLFKMNSEAWMTGYYRKPRIDRELMQQHSKGVIATTGCPSGEVQTFLRIGQYDEALKSAAEFRDIFGKDNFFIELMFHGLDIEKKVIPDLIKIGQQLNIPLLATNDSHYVTKDQAKAHDALLCISTRAKLAQEKRFRFDADDFYIKTAKEMRHLWRDTEDACDNTLLIAERCNISFKHQNLMPLFPVPEGETEETWLEKEIERGITERFPEGLPDTQTYRDRINLEKGTIIDKGYPSYFLVVADYIQWAKDNGIIVGPGRGCLTGDSLVWTQQGGYKPIKDITPGMQVRTHTGKVVPVTETFTYDVEENLHTIKTNYGGNGATFTSDHKILTRITTPAGVHHTTWTPAKSIKPGDWLCIPKPHYVSNRTPREQHPGFGFVTFNTLWEAAIYRDQLWKQNIPTSLHHTPEQTRISLHPRTTTHPTHAEADTNYIYVQVTENTTTHQKTKVYDLHVPIDHSFMTDSYVVHNSGAGSLIAYLLKITDLDPIPHRLLWERFLNPERDSMPDFDIDFDDKRRGEVIKYVIEKYGQEQVAQIATIGRIKAKNALKDAARIHDFPYSLGDRMSKAYPKDVQGKTLTLQEIFDTTHKRYPETQEFRDLLDNDPDARTTYDTAVGIEGLARQTGVHAAGVIMSRAPLREHIPLMRRDSDGAIITQFEYPQCEDLGLVKMDFLGLANLTIIAGALENIKNNTGETINLSTLGIEDADTFKLLAKGETNGVFQVEGGGITSLLTQMQPNKFGDISAALAVYRPGPMGMGSHIAYAERKNGRQQVTPIHPELEKPLEDILADTYGLCLYQEQVMSIAQRVAGYSLGKADNLRRAMGKKKKEVLDAEYIPFSAGMKTNGYSDEAIEALWEVLVPFSEYGFNSCLASRTLLSIPSEGKVTVQELYRRQQAGEKFEVLSMFEDGSIRPHKIREVVQSGKKPLYKIVLKSGKKIRVTREHRLLTTNGYGTIDDGKLAVGTELIVDELWRSRLSPETIAKRKTTMTAVNKSDAQREKARAWMTSYQSTLTYEDRTAHQQNVQTLHPERGKEAIKLALDEYLRLHEEDPAWKAAWLNNVIESNSNSEHGKTGWGKKTLLSDGRVCDSFVEALAGEYLISRGVNFEIHKIVHNPALNSVRVCDFYADGLYFEMDGLRRGRQFFVDNKYGEDIPFVYMTPLNYRDVIDEALLQHHIENGDEIVQIIPPKLSKKGEQYTEMTYDVEMCDDGPANFIADGIVSHNSHSAAYGLITYWTAYLKAHYPVEYMASLLTSNTNNKDKMAIYLGECRRMKIRVLAPDVNESRSDYAAVNGNILVGLGGIRNVGEGVVKAIIEERERGGKFKDFLDFLDRVDSSATSKRVVECLIKAGAFDNMGHKRGALYSVAHDAVDQAHEARKHTSVGQESLFGLFEDVADLGGARVKIPDDSVAWDKKLMLSFEREMLGLYITDHPLNGVVRQLREQTAMSVGSLLANPRTIRQEIVLGGVVSGVTRKISKGGDPWAIIKLEDIDGSLEALCFPKAFANLSTSVMQDDIVLMSGRVDLGEDGQVKFFVSDVKPARVSSDRTKDPLVLEISEKLLTRGAGLELREILVRNRGEAPVQIRIFKEDGSVVRMKVDDYKVCNTPGLIGEVKSLFGANSVLDEYL